MPPRIKTVLWAIGIDLLRVAGNPDDVKVLGDPAVVQVSALVQGRARQHDVEAAER